MSEKFLAQLSHFPLYHAIFLSILFYNVIVFKFLVSGGLFGVTAGLASWKYGGSTTANVLQSVSPSYAIRAAILITALQLCLSSALGHSALFQHLEDRWRVQRCEIIFK